MFLINNKSFSYKSQKHSIMIMIVLLDYFNIWVPRFCYHSKLTTSGNCRMCLVEVKGTLKPLVSCCTVIHSNMVVFTNTELVRRSREYIMEFLLINHPLDCPICDQSGECDLQDLSLLYGSSSGRFKISKKAILNKNLGSLIKTHMNRCIYCTRCVRYTSELNNTYLFNTLGRGGSTEIGNYFFKNITTTNYIDGNVIDLCPVGALTAKPYSFRSRSWEYVSIETIDILDSVCSNIRIDTRNNIVERILPKPNDNINEEWITDKIRFCYDGFKKQRLSLPFYKRMYKKRMRFVLSSWYMVFHKIKLHYNINYNTFYNNNYFFVYTGHLIDLFTLYTLKTYSSLLGINNVNINLHLNIDLRKYFIFNNNFKSFELNNVFLILGTNPKIDSPILNIKIRHLKFKYNKKVNVCYIGSKIIINYALIHLGINTNTLLSLLYGKSFFCRTIKKIYNIVCLFSIGFNLFLNNLFSMTLDMLSFFLKKQNFICNYITLFSSDVSIYELGITSYYFTRSLFISRNTAKVLYLLGVDYNNMVLNSVTNTFNIYHGHHGNIGLKYSDIVLPSNTFLESTGFFMNCEGRFLISHVGTTKKNKINNNTSILYNLFNFLFMEKRNKKYLKQLFLFFFYKHSFFFTKYKFVNKTYFNISYFFSSICLNNSYFTYSNNFYNMDVFNKSSFHIKNIKKIKKNNFLFNMQRRFYSNETCTLNKSIGIDFTYYTIFIMHDNLLVMHPVDSEYQRHPGINRIYKKHGSKKLLFFYNESGSNIYYHSYKLHFSTWKLSKNIEIEKHFFIDEKSLSKYKKKWSEKYEYDLEVGDLVCYGPTLKDYLLEDDCILVSRINSDVYSSYYIFFYLQTHLLSNIL